MNHSLVKMAAELGYTLEWHKPENRLYRFRREDGEVRIDIWDSTFTIGIIFKGKDPVFLKERDRDEIAEIFMSPELVIKEHKYKDPQIGML